MSNVTFVDGCSMVITTLGLATIAASATHYFCRNVVYYSQPHDNSDNAKNANKISTIAAGLMGAVVFALGIYALVDEIRSEPEEPIDITLILDSIIDSISDKVAATVKQHLASAPQA